MDLKIALLGLLIFLGCAKPSEAITDNSRDYAKLHKQAKVYCQSAGFNESYYFLVDLNVHSGKNRFFVYDFKQRKIVDENLVTHGSCDIPTDYPDKYQTARFNNKDGSHCSSKGKYKIGKRDYSGWGIKVKYWLHGLEPSNANAEKRVVVLHSWTAVSNAEIFPKHSPLSWGCPAVSDAFMHKLDARLQLAGKPVLLWITD